MSNTLMSFALSRAVRRIPSTPYYGSLRQLSCLKGAMLCSGDMLKLPDTGEPDSIYHDLRTANSAANVLKIVHENHRKMSDKHAVQALKTIFSLQKEGRSTLSTQKLITHPDFEKICKNIKKHSGVVDLNDTVETLKVLSYVGVQASSTIVQVLLQIIRSNVNSLNIPQILFLDFLLGSFESTPLVEALRIALPIVFDINVKFKMNDNNASQMCDCLHYAVKHNLSHETVHFIVNKLEKYQGGFEGDVARSVISSVCHLPRNLSYEGIINKAVTDLIVNIESVSVQKMEVILNKLTHKYTANFKFYYQEVLFDTCANYIIDHNIGFKRAIGVLRNMARLRHFHRPLADYVSTYLYENPSTEKDAADIYSLAVFLILTDYKPVHWDHLKAWIKSAKNLGTENRREIIWIRFAAALCILDIYKIDVLTRALKEDYIRHLIEKRFRSDYEHYFVIWQCLTAYKPDLAELLPSNWDPKDIQKTGFRPDVFPMGGALRAGLGGEQFVLTDLYSKLGVQIDHAIIFSKGSPVPLQTHVEYVEDIKLDTSQQLVLIWTGGDYYYTMNTQMMRGTITTSLSILEHTLKCSVIPVNLDRWLKLNDFEKIPYLMQKIKEKLGLDINVLESAL